MYFPAIPLCVHLQELDLRWSGLNDSGAKLIARVLPFTSIKELLLGNNRISDGTYLISILRPPLWYR